MNTTVSCKQCPKTFTHPTKAKAEQALLMHIGRKHKKNIIRAEATSGLLRQRRNGSLVEVPVAASGKKTRNYLTAEQKEGIVNFIRSNRDQYPSKTQCLVAAVAEVGATGQIITNSTAANRYFNKAGTAARAPGVKRKYTRSQPHRVEREVHVNFCPNCGCDMQAVATGIALATLKK